MPMNDRVARMCQCKLAAAPPDHTPVAMLEKVSRPIPTAVLSLLLAFFPKCPVCWATYMSTFGSVWLARAPYVAWLLPLLVGLSALNLLLLLKRAPAKGYGPFFLAFAGVAVVLGGRYVLPQARWLLLCGMTLMVASSLVSSLTVDRSEASTLQVA